MSRSTARELAMKKVFSRILGGNGTIEDLKEESEITDELTDKDRAFFDNLTKGVDEHREEIDAYIEKYAIGWSLSRIEKVDLAILRMATYEIFFCDEIPVGASINEAVELAKRFGGDHSYSFVNGILGTMVKQEKVD